MKKILRLSVFVLLAVLALSLCCCNYKNDNKNRQINSVSHRGYCDAPENTLSAYRLSAEKGFRVVETDVSFTKDGVAVLLHDNTIDRTSNGSGKISDLTYEEALRYDFGSWKDEKYIGEKIPLFSDFILLCKQLNLHPYIEIKNGATKEQVTYLAEIVNDNGMTVTWIARNAEFLIYAFELREQNESYGKSDRYGLIVDFITMSSLNSVSEITPERTFIDANYMFTTGTQINLCRRNNIALEVWTLDNSAVIANVHPYISGITSNTTNAEELFKTL